ncbi:MAG TPA: cyclic nucleotide-binding domain-containing protein [Acidimicrobiales bacterium]
MIEMLERCAALPERSLATGDVLVAEGDAPGALHVLVEGVLVVRKGDVQVAAIDRPGACVGEVGLLLGIPATATVVATTPVRVLTATDGTRFLQDDPQVAVFVARMLAERLHLVTTFLADLRRQYGGSGGSLAVVDTVLANLMQQSGPAARPGSARDPDPLY